MAPSCKSPQRYRLSSASRITSTQCSWPAVARRRCSSDPLPLSPGVCPARHCTTIPHSRRSCVFATLDATDVGLHIRPRTVNIFEMWSAEEANTPHLLTAIPSCTCDCRRAQPGDVCLYTHPDCSQGAVHQSRSTQAIVQQCPSSYLVDAVVVRCKQRFPVGAWLSRQRFIPSCRWDCMPVSPQPGGEYVPTKGAVAICLE